MTGRDFGQPLVTTGSSWDLLYRQAERQHNGGRRPQAYVQVAPETLPDTSHALEVHKIELELQNLELRRAQEALEISLARYCDLYELAPVSFITLSEQGRIIDVNLTASRLLGATKDSLLGAPLNRYIYSEDQDLLYLHCRQLFRTGHPQGVELRLLKEDGGSLLVWAELSPAQDDRGDPVCRVVMNDITQRRQQEMQLRLQSSALNLGSNEVLFADDGGSIEWVNEAFCKSTGFAPQEVLGKSLQELIQPTPQQPTPGPWQASQSGNRWQGEVTQRCKDGRLARRRLTLSPVKDLFGKNTHCIAVTGEPAVAPVQAGYIDGPTVARAFAISREQPKAEQPPESAGPERRILKRGRILFREGDSPRQLYQLHSGCIKLSRASLKGRDLIVELLYPGDYFDIYSLLHGGPTLFTASSLSSHPAELNCLSKSEVLDDTELMRNLQQQLVSRMRQQQEMMAALATLRVEQRVLLAMQILARREGQKRGADMVIPVPLTRQELGEMIGASAEASIRALSELHRRGVIDWEGRNLVCRADLFEDLALCSG